MKYTLFVDKTFSAAHALRGYHGKCERLHGHTWKVRVSVSGSKLNKLGMLIDFHAMKKSLGLVIARLDHAHINIVVPFIKINPTAENIATFIYEQMKTKLKKYAKTGLELETVQVWESETSSALVRETGGLENKLGFRHERPLRQKKQLKKGSAK